MYGPSVPFAGFGVPGQPLGAMPIH
jgi:hypothetical protein